MMDGSLGKIGGARKGGKRGRERGREGGEAGSRAAAAPGTSGTREALMARGGGEGGCKTARASDEDTWFAKDCQADVDPKQQRIKHKNKFSLCYKICPKKYGQACNLFI